jgi:hypothetical protein
MRVERLPILFWVITTNNNSGISVAMLAFEKIAIKFVRELIEYSAAWLTGPYVFEDCFVKGHSEVIVARGFPRWIVHTHLP